jgi:hypothetical protein
VFGGHESQTQSSHTNRPIGCLIFPWSLSLASLLKLYSGVISHVNCLQDPPSGALLVVDLHGLNDALKCGLKSFLLICGAKRVSFPSWPIV